MPGLVPRPDLQSAIALNSMGINVSRAIGPALAGVLIVWLGLAAPFAANALSFIGIVAALIWWRPAFLLAFLPLLYGRLMEQSQRLIGVGRDHHAIEVFAMTISKLQLHAATLAKNFFDTGVETDLAVKTFSERLHIAEAAANHRLPLRPIAEREQTMVPEETQERLGRKISRPQGRGRPDCRWR